jgi:hypothetical protein
LFAPGVAPNSFAIVRQMPLPSSQGDVPIAGEK